MAVNVYQEPDSVCAPAVKAVVEDIMLEVPGALSPVVEAAVLRAYREFFQKTKVWVRRLGPYDIVANSPIVLLDPVDAYRLVGFPIRVSLYDNEAGKEIRQIDNVARWQRGSFDTFIEGAPTSYYCENPGELRLYPTSSTTMENALIVYVSTYPHEKEFEIPLWLRERYWEGYRAGALRNLLLQPNKPYSSPDTAKYYGREFLKWQAIANADFKQNFQPNVVSWRYPRYA